MRFEIIIRALTDYLPTDARNTELFTRFSEVDLKAIEDEHVLAQLHKQELVSDDDVAPILEQDQAGFGVWLGDPFHDK